MVQGLRITNVLSMPQRYAIGTVSIASKVCFNILFVLFYCRDVIDYIYLDNQHYFNLLKQRT